MFYFSSFETRSPVGFASRGGQDRQRRELCVKEIPVSFEVEIDGELPHVISLQLCDELMRFLLIQEPDWIEPFRRRRAAPDHASVIKDPVFLDGIHEQLMDGRIASSSVFAQRVDMVWEQAMQLHGEGTAVHVLAQRWRAAVDSFWVKCVPAPVFDGQRMLEQAIDGLDKALSELEVFMPPLGPRPSIPPGNIHHRAWVRPQPVARVVQVLKPAGPVAITTAQQRRALAIRLRAERPESRAWAILKTHLREGDIARGSINLGEFSAELLTEVAAAIG